MGPMGSSSATGHYVEPMVSNSQCATADHYVNIVDNKKPTKSSDVYEHTQ